MVQYNLPIKLFVWNNDGLNATRSASTSYFNGRMGGDSKESGISFPDTSKIAIAYGIKFIKINEYEELDKKIDEVLNFDGPVICEVMMPRTQPTFPAGSSKINPDGTFSSRPLEDMAPFLDRDEYRSNLYVDEV